MRISISLVGNEMRVFEQALARAPGKVEQEIQRGLRDGGKKLTTQIRRALKTQTGVKRYGAIVAKTEGHQRGYEYIIEGKGPGLPIKEFPGRVTGKGVQAAPWRVSRTFARSFQQDRKGGLMARRTDERFPIRSLRGPNIARELIKDQSAATFEKQADVLVMKPIMVRLAKLLP